MHGHGLSNHTPRERLTVTLEKIDESIGACKLGAKYTTSFPADHDQQDAVVTAYRRLQRTLPGENPSCWEIEQP